MSFLPLSQNDMKKRGWDLLDVILVSGDAYVDHPSFGPAVIGRVLEKKGFRVGIIAQPDWKSSKDFMQLGKPRLFFGITAGNMDSMVSNYTAHKKPRKEDDYAPGGKAGQRPDRATIVYANRIREAFGDVPIVIGGIEASLRRFAHYDWWDNTVRRSILLDSRADILVYGMGETQVIEIAERLSMKRNLDGIRGTVVISPLKPDLTSEISNFKSPPQAETVEIPSYEEVREDTNKFNEAFKVIYLNQDPFQGSVIAQKHGNRFVIQYPPPFPLASHELDEVYELPFMKACHPSYDKDGGVPGFETVKFSLISHRGCPGQCSFCSLSMHQGRIVQSRSAESLVREARLLTDRKDFRGTINDIGGPTANLYKARCSLWQDRGACRDKSCLTPVRCKNLRLGYKESINTYKEIMKIPGVKHLFIESGIRYDLLIEKDTDEYLEHICRHHISGQMKVAPEHAVDHVLKIMNKPLFHRYEEFAARFKEINKKIRKDQYLVHYFISSHPGATLEDTLQLSLALIKKRVYPEQIQDFMPLPLTISGAMYYTGKHPLTGETVPVSKAFQERKMHRALIQYRYPKNRSLVMEALKILKKEDLAGTFLRHWQK
ncbi:MAG: YgiQ family radical SAM protein [Syntrophus sp. (in: bacteria)]|nr:YgiQ family radical SAM protein [Syntrophus sp. (in: bacteria)]